MSNAVAARKDERARRKAERMMEKQREAAEHDLPRSMRPSPITKTITVIVLVVALIYFLFPIYWAIIASTKTPSQLTSSNGLWFAVGLDQIPDAIATNYSKLMGWTRGQFWRWVLNSLIYSGVSALIGTIISVMAGYATAKFNFRGKAIAIGVVMGCMLMPVALLTIPQYSIFHALHLTNTMLAIIIRAAFRHSASSSDACTRKPPCRTNCWKRPASTAPVKRESSSPSCSDCSHQPW